MSFGHPRVVGQTPTSRLRRRSVRDNYRSARPAHGDNMQSTDTGKIAAATRTANHLPLLRAPAGTSALLQCASIVAIFASTVLLIAAASPVAEDPGEIEIDRSIKPGSDFYRYANGGWLRTVATPERHTSYDTRTMLLERTSRRVQDLIQEVAASHPVKGSVAQKVGDYYASFMDEDTIETRGLRPLGDELARISAIANRASLSAYLGSTLTGEVDGLTANADHIFGLWVNQGFDDAGRNVAHLWQGGL